MKFTDASFWRGQLDPLLSLEDIFRFFTHQALYHFIAVQVLCVWCTQLDKSVDVIFFTKTFHHGSSGWPFEREWPADSHQWRISPGTIQSRRHGDTEALDVLGGKLPGHHPARCAPSTPTGIEGLTMCSAVSFYCWLVKTVILSFSIGFLDRFIRFWGHGEETYLSCIWVKAGMSRQLNVAVVYLVPCSRGSFNPEPFTSHLSPQQTELPPPQRGVRAFCLVSLFLKILLKVHLAINQHITGFKVKSFLNSSKPNN